MLTTHVRKRRQIVAAGAGVALVAVLTPYGVASAADSAPSASSALPTASSSAASPATKIAGKLHVTATPWGEPSTFRATARLLVHDMPASRGGTTRATTLLFVPRGKAPVGGWPTVAWSHGTTTPGQRACAPSLTPDDLDGGLTRDGFASSYSYEIGHIVNSGYAVVAPDFEGLGPVATVPYPYFGAASAARSLISGVEAAREIDPSLSNRFAVVGHSEGAHGVLGVEAHMKEAPELRLTGTVALAPYGSIKKLVSKFARMGRTGKGVAASVGTTNAQFNVALMAVALQAQSPKWNASAIMGNDLKRLLPKFKTLCSVGAVALIANAIKAKSSGTFAGYKRGWAHNPQMKAFLAANDTAVQPGFTLHRPILIAQGTADTFVLKSLTSALVAKLHRKHAPVTYRTYAGDDHFSVIKDATPAVLTFLRSLFRR